MHDEQQRIIEELKEKQRNITWPEAMQNSRSVDELLWRGDPKAPLVQRVGIVLIASVFFFCSILLFSIPIDREWEPGFVIPILFGCGSLFVGFRILKNAFRHQKKGTHHAH